MVKYIGRLFVGCYRLFVRVRGRCFSLLISGAFAHFGKKTVVMSPFRLLGEERISLGDNVFIGSDSWLQTISENGETSIALSIGRGTSIAGACVISAAQSIVIEEDVLLARNVYISDHIHKYVEAGTPVLAQGIDKVLPVLIKRGAWLGQNVVVCPGVTIGEGAVIAANSVVNRDIPQYCVAAGAPAQVVKTISTVDR
jgi:acetyltransferase-like isoleucine patch superfamily enzyme